MPYDQGPNPEACPSNSKIALEIQDSLSHFLEDIDSNLEARMLQLATRFIRKYEEDKSVSLPTVKPLIHCLRIQTRSRARATKEEEKLANHERNARWKALKIKKF